MPPLAPVNVVHNLGPHGMLQCFSAPGAKFKKLRKACAQTSFAATHQNNLEDFFDEATIRALCQTNDKGPRQIVKGLDGHMVVVLGKQGEQRLQAVIRDPHICKPEGLRDEELHKGLVHCYVVVHPPKRVCSPFLLREGHMGVLPANHVSSFSPTDHVIAQMAAAIPLDVNTSRVIFESPNLGTLKGIMLKGEAAHVVKTSFINMLNNTNGDMYDMPIEMTPPLASALMLNNPSGMVCCAKLKNGLLGYREREDGGKTFTFVCNSHDFFDNEPTSDIDNSTLQIYKMSYADKSPMGPRISIEITGNEYKNKDPPCKYNTPVIRRDMTVQDVLNIIEFACRNAMLDHLGCADYPMHWHARKMFENEHIQRYKALKDDKQTMSMEELLHMINSNNFAEGGAPY